MSDEAAFLAALKANPADDTTRLVYADWLDENRRAAEAEYLRVLVGLVDKPQSANMDATVIDRAVSLADSLPIDWRMAAAARFTVTLSGYDPPQRMRTIKVISEFLDFGRAKAIALLELLPARLPLRTTVEFAVVLRNYLVAQAKCRVAVTTCETPAPPRIARCRIIADLAYNGWDDSADGPYRPPEVWAAWQQFIAALDIPDDIKDAAEREEVEVASDLDPAKLGKQLAKLRAMLPHIDPESEWEITLHYRCQLDPSP